MRCHRREKRTSRLLLVAASLAALTTSCGGSPHANLVPPPSQIAPGHQSPQAAVAGYMTGFANNDPAAICEYVVPAQRPVCNVMTKANYSVSNWRLGNSLVRGHEAIVVVVGDKFCAAKLCVKNPDPNRGLPRNREDNQSFDHAFDATVAPLPANSVVRLQGKWYVALA